jgi:hypothetical protein
MNTRIISISILTLSIIFSGIGLTLNYIHKERKWQANERREIIDKPDGNGLNIKIGKVELSLNENIGNESASENNRNDNKYNYRLIGGIFGILAIIMGSIYAILSKKIRLGIVPIALGLICVAWEYAMYAIGAAVLLLVLMAISS